MHFYFLSDGHNCFKYDADLKKIVSGYSPFFNSTHFQSKEEAFNFTQRYELQGVHIYKIDIVDTDTFSLSEE